MSKYSSISISSDSGFLFRPTYIDGYTRRTLLHVPIETPLQVTSDENFNVKNVTRNARGDIFYSSADPRLHPMKSQIPLRHGKLHVELYPRLGHDPVRATLAPGGYFEVLLGFWAKN